LDNLDCIYCGCPKGCHVNECPALKPGNLEAWKGGYAKFKEETEAGEEHVLPGDECFENDILETIDNPFWLGYFQAMGEQIKEDELSTFTPKYRPAVTNSNDSGE
jgi:hypothetical protein